MFRLASRRLLASAYKPSNTAHPIYSHHLRNPLTCSHATDVGAAANPAINPQTQANGSVGAQHHENPTAVGNGALNDGNDPPKSHSQGSQDAGIPQDNLIEQFAKKDAEIAELKDRNLRALAEMENVRAIARRDVANARDFGITAFARGMLVVADNLELALKSVPEDHVRDDPRLQTLHQGLQAIDTELLKIFRQNGIERFGAIGENFDPHRHDALFEAQSDSAKPGTILEVAKFGFSIGDRILRPAEVGVAKSA